MVPFDSVPSLIYFVTIAGITMIAIVLMADEVENDTREWLDQITLNTSNPTSATQMLETVRRKTALMIVKLIAGASAIVMLFVFKNDVFILLANLG